MATKNKIEFASRARKILKGLDKLTSEERARVEHALEPRRDKVMSLRTREDFHIAWKHAADIAGETLTTWVEKLLNTAAKK